MPTPDGPPTDPIHSTGRTTAVLGSQESNQSVRQLLKEWKGLGKNPPTYSGDNTKLPAIIDFFLALIGFFRLNLGWNEAEWIPVFPHTLIGKAQVWYQQLEQSGTSPNTWQEYQTKLCAQYIGPHWTERVQTVLTQPDPWGMQQDKESIIDFHRRWKEIHDLYALGTASRLPPSLETGFFISHLLPPFRNLVESQATFQLWALGSSPTTQDLDSLVQFLTRAENDPNFTRRHPTSSLNHIHGNQQGHYTSNPQRNNGRQPGFANNRGSNTQRRQTQTPAAARPQTHKPSPERTSLLPATG